MLVVLLQYVLESDECSRPCFAVMQTCDGPKEEPYNVY
jgi:hypothetical protein